jgi:hypothetical protein
MKITDEVGQAKPEPGNTTRFIWWLFTLCQFCSPVVGFFWFVPGLVEVDQVIKRLQRVRVSVTKFETAAFDGFN